jgi:hypothetical protein
MEKEVIDQLGGSSIQNPPKKLFKKFNIKIHECLDKIQKISFFLLVIFICGSLLGTWGSYKFYKIKMHECVLVGGILIDGEVYNLSHRDVQLLKPEQNLNVEKKK